MSNNNEVIIQVLYATEDEESAKQISDLILKYLPSEVIHDSFYQTSDVSESENEPEFETLFRLMVAPASLVSVLEIVEAVMTAQVDSTDIGVFEKLYGGHEVKVISDLNNKQQTQVNKDMIDYLYDRVQQLQLDVNDNKLYTFRTQEEVTGINELAMSLGTYVTQVINIRKMAELVKHLCIETGNNEVLDWLEPIVATEH